MFPMGRPGWRFVEDGTRSAIVRPASHHRHPRAGDSLSQLLGGASLALTRDHKLSLSMSSEPIIASSALKHGVGREDILHAYRNPLRVWDLGDGFTMMVGPNRAAIILEVGYIEGGVAMVIVHAMPARDKFLR